MASPGWTGIPLATPSNDPCLPHFADFSAGIAHLLQYLLGMFPELRRGAADCAGRGGELGHDARHLERLAVAGDDALDHAARSVVRVGGDIGGAVDLSRGDFRLLHFTQYFSL